MVIVYTLTVLTSILAGLPTAVKSGMSQITTAPANLTPFANFKLGKTTAPHQYVPSPT
jgi:hypothetical protein